MFNRLSQSFINLTEREQLVILRKMIEGDLDIEVVLSADSMNHLRGLLRHGDQIASFASDTDALVERTNAILGKTKGMDILEEYQALSIQDRQRRADEYEIKLKGSDQATLRSFKKICDKDSAIVVAVEVLVSILASKLYAINDMSTSDQCVIMNQLKANPEAAVKTTNMEARAAIASFQRLFDILTHSYIDADVNTFLKLATSQILSNEVQLRTQINKTIKLLIGIKERIDREVPPNSTPGLFNKTTHGHAREVSATIKRVTHADINILNGSNNMHIETIKNAFTNIYQIVKSEECGTLRRRSFWDDMLDQMNGVIAEENHFLQMDVQAVKNLRK